MCYIVKITIQLIALFSSEQFLNSHRNPIMRVEPFGAKLFFKSNNQETDLFEKCFNNLIQVLSNKRVEKRYYSFYKQICANIKPYLI